jgi:hypothetical protein
MAYTDLFGKPGETQYFSKLGPQHQTQSNQLLTNILNQLSGNLGRDNFKPIEDRSRRDFSQKTLPTLAERFSAFQNNMNALSSPALEGQKTQAGLDLETNLAALRSDYQGQQNNQLMNLLQLLSPQSSYFTRQPGFIENLGVSSLPGLTSNSFANSMSALGQPQGEQNWIGKTGNVVSAVSPLLAAIPGWGPLLALAGTAAGGLASQYGRNTPAPQVPGSYKPDFSWNQSNSIIPSGLA